MPPSLSRHRPTHSLARAGIALVAAGGVALGAWLLPAMSRAQTAQPRVIVVVSPDTAGPPRPGVPCGGCDGAITAVDALGGSVDPLPALAVTLRDAAGAVAARATTHPEGFGAQATTFVVAAPGRFSVEVAPVAGWARCPGRPGAQAVTPADFGADAVARVDASLWRGCAATELATPAASFTVTSGTSLASPSMLAPSAVDLRMPQAGAAVQSSGRLMFGLAATAVTIGLLGLAYESGFARRS